MKKYRWLLAIPVVFALLFLSYHFVTDLEPPNQNSSTLTIDQVTQSIQAAAKDIKTHCSPITDSQAKLLKCFGEHSKVAEKQLADLQDFVTQRLIFENQQLMTAIEEKKKLRRKLLSGVKALPRTTEMLEKHWPDNLTSDQLLKKPMCVAMKAAYKNIDTCRSVKKRVLREACVRDIFAPAMSATETASGKPPEKYRKQFNELCDINRLIMRMESIMKGY